MSEQLTLGYEALKSVFLDAAEEVQSAVNKKFGTPVSLAAGSDRVVAQRQAAQAAGDIASREAGVGAVEGMRARPTDVDFRAPTERARTVADAARPTTAGGISPAEARRTVPGEKLLDAPSGPRDPALRLTEADAGVSQRFQAGRPTTIDRTPFAERATVQGESVLARQGTPTTVDRTPFAERATVQGESALAKRGTPTIIDEARQLQTALRSGGVSQGTDEAMSLLDDVISRAQTSRGGRMAAGLLEAVKAMPAVQRVVPTVTKLGRFAGPVGLVGGVVADTVQAVSDLAETQDPLEQLRFVYEQQGSQPLKIGRGGLSQKAMEDLVEKNPNAVFNAIDQGILDPSVGEMLGGAPEKTKQEAAPAAAKSRTEIETIPITADAPKTAPARGSNLLAMGSRGAGVQKIQEDLTALNQFENLLSGKMPGARGPFDPGVSGVDGVFGTDTQAAVKAFQKSAGITEDGIVGPETRDALKKALDASKSAVKLQRSQAEEIKSMPSPAEPPTFGAGLQRVDEGPLEAAASEFEDITEIEPVKSDRDAPIQNTQAYEDLELDEKPRRTAFPMARDFRRRRNRR